MDRRQIIDKFSEFIVSVTDLKNFLRALYNDVQFVTVFNKPTIQLLINGCDWLLVNLTLIRDRYKLR